MAGSRPDDNDANFAAGARAALSGVCHRPPLQGGVAVPESGGGTTPPRSLAARYYLADGPGPNTQRVDECHSGDAGGSGSGARRDVACLHMLLGTCLTSAPRSNRRPRCIRPRTRRRRRPSSAWETADPTWEGVEAAYSDMYHFLAVYAQRCSAGRRSCGRPSGPSNSQSRCGSGHSRDPGDGPDLAREDRRGHEDPRWRRRAGAPLFPVPHDSRVRSDESRAPRRSAHARTSRSKAYGSNTVTCPTWIWRTTSAMEAWILDALGRYEDAEDDSRECIDLAKDKSAYPAQLESVLRHAGKPARALREGECAIERQLSHLQPCRPTLLRSFRLRSLGEPCRALGHPRTGEEALSQVLSRRPVGRSRACTSPGSATRLRPCRRGARRLGRPSRRSVNLLPRLRPGPAGPRG